MLHVAPLLLTWLGSTAAYPRSFLRNPHAPIGGRWIRTWGLEGDTAKNSSRRPITDRARIRLEDNGRCPLIHAEIDLRSPWWIDILAKPSLGSASTKHRTGRLSDRFRQIRYIFACLLTLYNIQRCVSDLMAVESDRRSLALHPGRATTIGRSFEKLIEHG